MLPTLLAALLAAPPYGSVRAEAEPVSNLGRYLEEYLGECESDAPEFDRAGCEDRAAAVRKQRAGVAIRLEVEELEGTLAFSGYDERKKLYRLLLTPFFAGRELAITVGRPTAGAKDGLPTVKNIPIWVALPDGEPEFAFRRKLERGMVRLEVVLEPGAPWALKRKDGDGAYRGVEARLLGLRVSESRAERVLAEQSY